MSNKLIDNIINLDKLITKELKSKDEHILMLNLVIDEYNNNFKQIDKLIFERQQQCLKLISDNNKLLLENKQMYLDNNNMKYYLKIIIYVYTLIHSVYLLNLFIY